MTRIEISGGPGGLGTLTDEIKKADEGNPKGYYQLEIIKTLKRQEEIEIINLDRLRDDHAHQATHSVGGV